MFCLAVSKLVTPVLRRKVKIWVNIVYFFGSLVLSRTKVIGARDVRDDNTICRFTTRQVSIALQGKIASDPTFSMSISHLCVEKVTI